MPPAAPPEEDPIRRIVARRMLRWARREAGSPSFGRLLILQALGAAGDALVALALAGSLFFSVPEATARNRVVLYLLLTLAPLGVVAPILSGLVDRHGAGLRAALVVAAGGRAALALLLASELESLFLFPLAFGILALSRAALVARGAILPLVVPGGRPLVAANGSLAKASALAGIVAVPIGAGVVLALDAHAEVLLAAVVYCCAVVPAWRLPSPRGARDPRQRLEARGRSRPVAVRQAVVATAGMRLLVGFIALHLAFALRREELGTIGLGLLIGSAALGALLGAALAGRIRAGLREEGIIVSSLATTGIVSLAVGMWFSVVLAGALVFAYGVAAGAAKVAFDALVQRDTPEAARGWAFARYESGLQLSWVAGALVPVALPIPVDGGIIAAGVLSGLLATVYALGRRRALGPRLEPS